MRRWSLTRDADSYASQLRSCITARNWNEGREVHSQLRDDGLEENRVLGKLLIQMYGKCRCVEDARSAFDRIAAKNTFCWNVMVAAYAQNGHLLQARKLFDQTPEKQVFSWNIIITAYIKSGDLQEAMNLFEKMENRNQVTWNLMIGAYAQNGHLCDAKRMFDGLSEPSLSNWTSMISGYAKNGQMAEAEAMYSRLSVKDAVARTAMMTAYARNGYLQKARNMFDEALQDDPVPWTVLISAYSQSLLKLEAVSLFRKMDLQGIVPDKKTFIHVFFACGELELSVGKSIHAEAAALGLESDVVVATALLNMYGKSGELDTVEALFQQMSSRDVVSWTALITAFGGNCHFRDARVVFDLMPERNLVSWTAVITAYCEAGLLEEARELLLDQMPERDIISSTAFIAAMAKFGYLEDARIMFDSIKVRDIVLWTAMISALSLNGLDRQAIELFGAMDLEGVHGNTTTFLAILEACANAADLKTGKLVHADATLSGFSSDIKVRSAIVNMYGKCGNLVEAKAAFDKIVAPDVVLCNAILAAYAQNGCFQAAKLMFDGMSKRNLSSHNAMLSAYAQSGYMLEAKAMFDGMVEKDVVTWSGMIAAYVRNGDFRKALRLFLQMDLNGVKPEKLTFVSVCDACGNLSNLSYAKLVYEELVNKKRHLGALLAELVIVMFGKCGSLDIAKALFDKSTRRDADAWNALLASCSHNGQIDRVRELFKLMLLDGSQPNVNTFIILLAACSHAGLTKNARAFFLAMEEDHKLPANCDHYVCMVDALARAGMLRDAEDLIRNMPFQPDALAWTSLLGGCRDSTDTQRGGCAAEEVAELEPKNAAPYLLLCSLYRHKSAKS